MAYFAPETISGTAKYFAPKTAAPTPPAPTAGMIVCRRSTARYLIIPLS